MSNCLIVDFGSKHVKELQEMISDSFDNISIIDDTNFSVNDDIDFIILGGASNTNSIMRHSEDYLKIINFIKVTDKPVLGICFGCELIAKAFDCIISDSGFKKVDTQNVCFKDSNFCIEAFEAHRFYIEKTSDQIEVLATGENNSIEVIKCINKPIIGTQFHPEVSKNSKEIFKEIFKVLKDLMK